MFKASTYTLGHGISNEIATGIAFCTEKTVTAATMIKTIINVVIFTLFVVFGSIRVRRWDSIPISCCGARWEERQLT